MSLKEQKTRMRGVHVPMLLRRQSERERNTRYCNNQSSYIVSFFPTPTDDFSATILIKTLGLVPELAVGNTLERW